MWQSSISAEGADELVLEQIGTRLIPLVDRLGGIVLRDKISDRARLSVAVNDRHADAVKTELNDAIAGVIGQYYKEKYLSGEISLEGKPEYFRRAYLQALVSFDQAYEHEYIKVMLPESETLSLDGLLRFRCDELKNRWREIAELAMETAACSVNQEVCLELIKFLVSTLDSRFDRARVSAADQRYQVELCKAGTEKIVYADADDLCAALIRDNPSILTFEEGLSTRKEIELAKSIFMEF